VLVYIKFIIPGGYNEKEIFYIVISNHNLAFFSNSVSWEQN